DGQIARRPKAGRAGSGRRQGGVCFEFAAADRTGQDSWPAGQMEVHRHSSQRLAQRQRQGHGLLSSGREAHGKWAGLSLRDRQRPLAERRRDLHRPSLVRPTRRRSPGQRGLEQEGDRYLPGGELRRGSADAKADRKPPCAGGISSRPLSSQPRGRENPSANQPDLHSLSRAPFSDKKFHEGTQRGERLTCRGGFWSRRSEYQKRLTSSETLEGLRRRLAKH